MGIPCPITKFLLRIYYFEKAATTEKVRMQLSVTLVLCGLVYCASAGIVKRKADYQGSMVTIDRCYTTDEMKASKDLSDASCALRCRILGERDTPAFKHIGSFVINTDMDACGSTSERSPFP